MTDSQLKITERPSPNFDDRCGRAIDILLLHYTGMESGEVALERLCDEKAKVGAHYLIEEDGHVFRLVAEDKRAWHAGRAHWAGENDINACSIGIELVNPGHEFGYRDFPEAQMESLVALGREILARHAIPANRVLGHSDVAPARKEDPGELFDWESLAGAGIGLWPGSIESNLDRAAFFAGLKRFGYGVGMASEKQLITAFQRRFRPNLVDGLLDQETAARLHGLLSALDLLDRGA